MQIPTRTILKVLAVTATFLAILALAFIARRELIWIGTAFFFAVALNPAVEHIAKYMPKKSRGLAVTVLFLFVLGLFAFLLISFIPPLVSQSESLTKHLPHAADSVINGNGFWSDQIRKYNLVDRIRQSQDQLGSYVSNAGSQAFGIGKAIFSGAIAASTIIVLLIFMILEGPRWVEIFWKVVPLRRREHDKKIVHLMYRAVTGYVTGNLLTSAIIAVAVALVLTIVGVSYAIPLGIFVGMIDLLPLVGATLGAVLVVLVAFFTSFTAGIVTLVFFLIYQQIENHVLQPIVYGKTVEISPLLVLIAVLIGATVGGLIGALVAIPVFASLQIVIRDYAERHLVER